MVVVASRLGLRGRHLETGWEGLQPISDEVRWTGDTRNAPSIKILIKRICIAFNGLLRWNTMLSVIKVRAATAVLSWNDRKF